MIHRLPALAVLAAPLLAQGEVPTPESVLGHVAGADFELASYDEGLRYMRALAETSGKVQLVRVGETSFGLDWHMALISSEANLARLEHHKEISRRLSWAKDLSDDEARALAREGRAIVHIDGGLHASEAACAQHTLQLAYELVREDPAPEVPRILDEVILMLWFSINPDGQNMIAEWYEQNLGTPFEVSSMPWLYQKYVGHDNNRDGYMNNMHESRVVTGVTLEYCPQVFYNHHQTAPFPARIWIPPFAEPVSSNVHPLMWRWVNVFGTSMAAWLDERDMPGAIHHTVFDNWYPGFIDNVNSFRNTIAYLSETALYRYATPKFYTVDDFPRERRDLRTEVMYASPWKGGWWHIGDAVRYMIGASMSTLDTAARYRENLLFNRYRAGRDTIARYTDEPPYAYVIPAEQWDAPTADHLAEILVTNGIELHEATAPFTVNGAEYGAGSRVVLMDQPYASLVKELFEVQTYPELRDSPDAPLDIPYDVTGWTLPLQMGVATVAVAEPVGDELRASLRRLDGVPARRGSVVGQGHHYTASHRANASLQLVDRLLEAGAKVSLAPGTRETPAGPEVGSIVATGVRADVVRAIASETGVSVLAGSDAAPEDAIPLAKPRIGMVRPWRPSMDEGWTRWLFDTRGIEHTSLRNADVRAGRLRERFDTIVVPNIGGRTLREGYAKGMVPGRYAGGLGDEGVAELRRFVAEGGTLVTWNRGALFAIDALDLAVEDAVADLESREFHASGALVGFQVTDPAHPVTMGMPDEAVAMFADSPVFRTKPGFRGRVLAEYPEHGAVVRSGSVLGADELRGRAAVVEASFGEGRAILIGFGPQWRGQPHGTFKLVLNSIFYGQAAADAVPAASEPKSAKAAEWSELDGRVRSSLDDLARHAIAARDAGSRRAMSEIADAIRHADLAALEDFGAAIGGAAADAVEAYGDRVRSLLVDLPGKDLSMVDDYGGADLVRAYGLSEASEAVRRALDGR